MRSQDHLSRNPSRALTKNLDYVFPPIPKTTSHSRQLSSQDPLPQLTQIRSGFFSKENSKSQSLQKPFLGPQTSETLTNLKNSLHNKIQNSKVLNTHHMSSIKTSAAKPHKYSTSIILNPEKQFSDKTRKMNHIKSENALVMPENLMKTFEKPALSTRISQACEERVRSLSSEFPSPSIQQFSLEILSGNMISKLKPYPKLEVLHSENHDRGFCYKIDPIYNDFTYDQAIHYLNLRRKGAKKSMAARLSHKISCNLYEKKVKYTKSYSNSDEEYDKLTARFEEYSNMHPFKEGEISKDELIHSEFFELLGMYSKPPEECQITVECMKLEEIEEKKEEPKKTVSMKKMKKDKRVKSFEINEGVGKKSEFDGELTRVGSRKETEGQVSIENGIRFVVKKVVPKKKGNARENSENFKELEKIEEFHGKYESDEEREPDKEKKKKKIKDKHKDKGEKGEVCVDLKTVRSQNLIDAHKKVMNHEKLTKKKEKKQEIQSQSIQNLQESLVKKLQRLKQIAENKKKIKEEGLKVSKMKKNKFMEKVKVMKEKKETEIIVEAEQTNKRRDEKMRKAEDNKKKLEIEREKKLEEQKMLYDSQRLFIEYLRSLPLIRAP